MTGITSAVETCECVSIPGFLFVTTASLLGGLHVLVYRSIRFIGHEDGKEYRSVRDLVGDAVPLIRAVVRDTAMMGHKAEILTYQVYKEGPKAMEAA